MSCFSFPICQCRGTVFIKIWWQVMMIAIYSSIIVMIHKKLIFASYGFHVTIPWTLVPILGVATGMLLVFRTNTAYDRYWEARKLWSSMTTATRNLVRNIWVGIKEPEDPNNKDSKILVEKVSALNLLAAFGYATRNYLRGEYSYEDQDLKQLLRHVPKFYNMDCKCTNSAPAGGDGKSDGWTVKSSAGTKPRSDEGEGIAVMLCRNCFNTKKTYKYMAYEEETPTNIPMELSYLLGAYIKNANSRNLIDPSLLAPLNNALNSLVDCITGFERILRTPIPLAYSVHLHHATWIYLLTLPSQLVEALGWGTACATALAAFCLLGVLEIGWEIENPFGREFNDLPLDDFCRVTHREIQKIMGRKIPPMDVWVFSPQNRPLAPVCAKNASELARLPPDDLRSLMKRNPMEIRKYFQNHAFIPDEPEEEKKPNPATFKASPSPPPPSSAKSSKSNLASRSGSEAKASSESIASKTSHKSSESISKALHKSSESIASKASNKSAKSAEEVEAEEEQEEEEEEEVSASGSGDISSKRVSFALPTEEEGDEGAEVKELPAEDEPEEEEEAEEEEEEEEEEEAEEESSEEEDPKEKPAPPERRRRPEAV